MLHHTLFYQKLSFFRALTDPRFCGPRCPRFAPELPWADATTSARIILRFAILSLDESLILDLFYRSSLTDDLVRLHACVDFDVLKLSSRVCPHPHRFN